jgi:hypothetical protein
MIERLQRLALLRLAENTLKEGHGPIREVPAACAG